MTQMCPLCTGSNPCHLFASDSKREYYACSACGSVHVPRRYWLSDTNERARYALHDNSAGNPDYVRYLGRYVDLVGMIPVSKPRVLDFGCGEEAVLTGMLEAAGYECVPYDPLYGLTKGFQGEFDIVLMCEVFEHLKKPREELDRIASITENGFVIMQTRYRPESKVEFQSWWYKEDPTHILFAAQNTIEHVSAAIGKRVWKSQRGGTVILGPVSSARRTAAKGHEEK